jgi:succinate dehydrogenase/fumarate reductase flavoprotein subunit
MLEVKMASESSLLEQSMESDVIVLGSGAAGCGAAMGVRSKGARVLLIDKGKLESSGCLGGGHDHFMAVLHSGPETDTTEAVVNFYAKPMSGLTPKVIEEGWVKMMPIALDILQEVGVEFIKNEDGTWMRTVGFGQPGNWWINIKNGAIVKRLLAKKVRDMGVDVVDHVMVTKLLKDGDRIAGCVGFNVLDGTFHVFRGKKVIMAMGNVANRGWTNSTGNPYNVWFSPYNTGSQFVLSYGVGAKILNMDVGQMATLIPKGFGAPGMNGINSMGGHELNALGERFMGKYDPMWENGLRVNQISGTYQELIEGKGPPFYMDMTHLDKEDVHHLQYILMPGDKETYLDYCEQRNIDFAKYPLEVEVSELAFGGLIMTQDNMETSVKGLYNACLFFAFSGSMCGGYYAGLNAAETALQGDGLPELDEVEITQERERVLKPMKTEKGIHYKEVEDPIRQVMNYYVGYRRNQKGLETALEKLTLIESYLGRIKATNPRELMKANETAELVQIAKLTVRACMDRKESGRGFYRRTDYPEMHPDLNRPLVAWQDNGEPKFAWSD